MTPRGKGSQDCHSDYLHSARGVDCRPEQNTHRPGSEYLLMLLIPDSGKRQENRHGKPHIQQAYRVLKVEGYPVIPVDMADMEWMCTAFPQQRGCGLCDAFPSVSHRDCHACERRQELLAWAYSGADRYLIEDDYDSEFRYKESPFPALQGMDRGGRVILHGTFSKSIPRLSVWDSWCCRAFAGGIPERAVSIFPRCPGLTRTFSNQFITQGY